MERRDGSIAKGVETYLGADLNPLGATVSVNVMDNEAAPSFVVDQGLYCPAPTGYYGYYCTGYQAAGGWDNDSRVLQLDNQDLHYSALQAEGLPYVYYPPNYGYAQSAYNPFNPYIPGAIIGMDGQFVGSQPYCSSTPYQHAVSSSSYSPMVFQPSPDIPTCSVPANSLLSVPVSSSSGLDGLGGTYATPASVTTVTISDGLLKPKREEEKQSTSIQNVQPVDTESVPVASKGATCPVPSSSTSKVNASDSRSSHSSESRREGQHQAVSVQKLQPTHVKPGTSEGVLRQLASPEMFSSTSTPQSSSASAIIQVKDYIPLRRLTPVQRPVDITVTTAVNGVVDVGSGHHGWPMNNKSNKPLHFGMAVINMDRSPDALSEQNRGPRTSRTKNQWTSPLSLRVYSTRAFSNDVKENILIYADHYNRDDFPVGYPDAKFFVIKSYSEDDVHKSIKYNVWSSTPNGNKRLDAAYADAQRRSGGKHRACPVFLFFSVNASGQFCGVAEMIGPVDFQKDMDFWQQDKWNGSFPVKWHLIKDVPNPHFRHIILENNENKPVTNSRDTQEVKYTQGIEMLKIFKSYFSKTSILDDFMYYEERQRALFDKKTKYHNQSYKDLTLDTSMTNSKPVGTVDLQTSQVLPQTANDAKEDTKTVPVEDVDNMLSTVKISSLESEPEENNSNVSCDIVTVGSMPIKVNGYNPVFSSSADKARGSDDNLSILTVGTISIDPKALKLGKHGSFAAGNRSTCRV